MSCKYLPPFYRNFYLPRFKWEFDNSLHGVLDNLWLNDRWYVHNVFDTRVIAAKR